MRHFPKARPSDGEQIEARAAAWLAQRDDGFSAEDAAQFARWCEQDPRHAAAVQRLERTWQQLVELRSYRPAARAHPDPDLLAPKTRARRMHGKAWTAGLAAAALAACAIFATRQLNWAHASPVVYATTHGGYQRATLDDGSVVELNSDTEVRIDYHYRERRVVLARGEAHFTVAHDEHRPFWVEAENVAVRAVGTSFDVRVAQQNVEVLVTAGAVRVSPETRARESDAYSTDPILNAGWRAVIPRTENFSPQLEKIATARVKDMLGWQSPRLTFVDMPLGEVIEQFNQRNDVQLVLADPELAKMAIGGSFSADNVEAFVRLLTSNGDLTAETRSNTIILRRGK